MLPIKKIYVDTRLKTPDSRSHSDFHIDLPTTMRMPDDTGFYIDDVCIPHAWYPIEVGVNDSLLYRFDGQPNAYVTIPFGNYTVKDLAQAIAKALDDDIGAIVF